MDATLTRLLDVLAELDDNVLRSCYRLDRADDSPLEQALFAWRDAGAPRSAPSSAASPVSVLPKVGDRVTGENVGALPVGTVVEGRNTGGGPSFLFTKQGSDEWRTKVGIFNYTDAEIVGQQDEPAYIHALPGSES